MTIQWFLLLTWCHFHPLVSFGHSWLEMATCEGQKPFHFITNSDCEQPILILQRKCDIYWPREEGTEIYGQIAAQLEKEEIMADFTIRTIKIKHVKVSGTFGKYLKRRHTHEKIAPILSFLKTHANRIWEISLPMSAR